MGKSIYVGLDFPPARPRSALLKIKAKQANSEYKAWKACGCRVLGVKSAFGA